MTNKQLNGKRNEVGAWGRPASFITDEAAKDLVCLAASWVVMDHGWGLHVLGALVLVLCVPGMMDLILVNES